MMADDARDALVVKLMAALHSHLPEDQRPMAMSDLSDEQAERARLAVQEILGASAQLIYVPGQWRCAKCGFVLNQRWLNAGDGSVTARDEPGEKCPNDGSPLWRTTWRDEAMELGQRLEEEFTRRGALEERLARSVPREPTIEMLVAGRKQTFADMTGAHMGPSAENTWKAMFDAWPKQEEKMMIPKEQADLADALVAEFGHELSQDEAVAKAGRILDYFKRQGWKIVELVG
jgi:hypothetical protein